MSSGIKAMLFAVPLVLTQPLVAGVNGTYRVSGSEKDHGEKFTFTGSVKITNYKSGIYNLKFSDGEQIALDFALDKRLKDGLKSQTVTGSNNRITTSATFQMINGRYQVQFSYRSKDGNVRGQGSGSK